MSHDNSYLITYVYISLSYYSDTFTSSFLQMKVTSKNLLNVCKLLFALSKDEKNDTTFRDERISAPLVDLLLTADPLVDCDTMVYGLGTVKLLASNGELRDQLIGAGVMGLMATTLQRSTEQASQQIEEGARPRVRNILIQVQVVVECCCFLQ